MPFKNRIRLPLYLKQPQFPAEANRFRLANGATKTQSVVIRKTYNLVTDYMPERMHQRLTIALNHDEVNIEASRFLGGIAVDGDYKIEWPDFLDYPLGQAEIQVQVTPFAATNDNCQTCEDVTQISLVDDTIADPIPEGDQGTVNAFDNDSICCSPITAEIISFNTTYVDAAVIDEETGIVTITIKDPAPSGTGVLLGTYRVTCPNGGYDEADIYGTIEGSETPCEYPYDFERIDHLPGVTTETINWTGTATSFEWQLFTCDNLGTPVDTGTTTDNFVSFDDLDPGGCYVISVRANCDGSFSGWASFEFNVPAPETRCGRFDITCDDGTTNRELYSYSYMLCNGIIENDTIVNLSTKSRCMLTDEFNDPIYFEGESPVNYEYDAPC